MEFWDSVTGIVNLSIPVLDNIPALRGILGVLLVFFVPGFAWTLLFFKTVNVLERIVLSVALSVALVTLAVVGLNIALKVPVTGLNGLIAIVVITIIPLAIRYRHKVFGRNRQVEAGEE